MISSKKKVNKLEGQQGPNPEHCGITVRSKMALYMAISVLCSFFPVFVLYLAVAVQVLPTRQQLLRISQSFFQSPPIQCFFFGDPGWKRSGSLWEVREKQTGKMCRYACQALTGLQALLSYIYLATIHSLAN
ncbi:hypothetical protein CHARACLAT_029533 [Characodon lateralis]|uniref:Uncharacterized protein n=1 Tax=Characodon lateralis TaxID=208331 RepID=A0ABU7EEE4_9TELE|nr:hypothetical protein [Characodon lateralis]